MTVPAPVRCYLGLGANLGDPAAQVRAALKAIAALPDTRLIAVSSFYRSAPMGPGPQPDYCNAACALDTLLEPMALLQALQALERAAGRVRDPSRRWHARELDLDLLLYGETRLDLPGLTLPHPGIGQRNFVLAPLHDLAPALEIPGQGPVASLLAACGREGLRDWG